MRKTKIEACYLRVNDNFADRLNAAFARKCFGVQLETNYNIFHMAMVSTRADGKNMTKEQHAFVAGYGEGYLDAMNQISEGVPNEQD